MTKHYDKETGEWVETSGINVALWPVTAKQRWLCPAGHPVLLFPISKDEPAQYWQCECRTVTIKARDQAFTKAIEEIKQKYKLKTLDYDHQNHYFTMVSSQFIDRDRIESVRKEVGPTEEKEIISELVYLLKTKLAVIVESMSDYFVE